MQCNLKRYKYQVSILNIFYKTETYLLRHHWMQSGTRSFRLSIEQQNHDHINRSNGELMTHELHAIYILALTGTLKQINYMTKRDWPRAILEILLSI